MRIFLVSTFLAVSALFNGAIGQLRETKHFASQDSLCSRDIILDSTGLFFKKWKCEERTNVSFGRYQIEKGNHVYFQSLPFDRLPPVSRVVTESIIMEYEPMVIITFYDRFKVPLAMNGGIRLVDKANNVHKMQTDEKGQVEINRFIYKELYLEPVLSMYGTSCQFDLGRESFSVYLNLPGLLLDEAAVHPEKLHKQMLQLKKEGLYDTKMKIASYKLQ